MALTIPSAPMKMVSGNAAAPYDAANFTRIEADRVRDFHRGGKARPDLDRFLLVDAHEGDGGMVCARSGDDAGQFLPAGRAPGREDVDDPRPVREGLQGQLPAVRAVDDEGRSPLPDASHSVG